MRDIKFRCWDTENKEMLDVQELDYADSYNGQPMIRTTMYNDYFDTEEIILMQYTGLKDKNGKEIYEGDIVRTFALRQYINGYVKYNNDRGRFDIGWMSEIEKYKNNGFVGSLSCMTNDYDCLEIIGNIYENQGLLEKEGIKDE